MQVKLKVCNSLKKSIIDDFKRGIRIDSIIASVGSSFVRKSERKIFVYNTIYEYLMESKRSF